MVSVLLVDTAGAGPDCFQALYTRATEERKQRADRYRQQEDKLRCVVADALLRAALRTDDYRTQKNSFGKPCIQGREDFSYNLSHSGRYVVLAWGSSEVGVDVQRQDAATKTQAIGERFFTPDEHAYIRGDLQRFYEIWTKKESYLKYTGQGLHRDLKSFSVLAPEPEIRFLYRTLDGGYSLCLCTTEDACTLDLLSVQQLQSLSGG